MDGADHPWTSRLSTSSRRYQSRSEIYLGGDDVVEVEDDYKQEYLCPFCAEEFDVVGLCCHSDEDHPIELKQGVEFAHGGRGYSSSDRHSSYSGSSHRGGVSRHSDYRVLITGLPSSASWQDLKDHMRRAGDVCFSQVFRDRGRGVTGVVDYTSYDDMRRAIRKLDDSEFRNAFSRGYYIRVRECDSRSPSPYGRSRSRSLRRLVFCCAFSCVVNLAYL